MRCMPSEDGSWKRIRQGMWSRWWWQAAMVWTMVLERAKAMKRGGVRAKAYTLLGARLTYWQEDER